MLKGFKGYAVLVKGPHGCLWVSSGCQLADGLHVPSCCQLKQCVFSASGHLCRSLAGFNYPFLTTVAYHVQKTSITFIYNTPAVCWNVTCHLNLLHWHSNHTCLTAGCMHACMLMPHGLECVFFVVQCIHTAWPISCCCADNACVNIRCVT